MSFENICVLLFIYTFIYMFVEFLYRMVLLTKRFNSKVEPEEIHTEGGLRHGGYSSTHNYNLRSRKVNWYQEVDEL